MEWDPFCPHNLATGGADGIVKLWRIPPEGLQQDLIAPLVSFSTCEPSVLFLLGRVRNLLSVVCFVSYEQRILSYVLEFVWSELGCCMLSRLQAVARMGAHMDCIVHVQSLTQ